MPLGHIAQDHQRLRRVDGKEPRLVHARERPLPKLDFEAARLARAQHVGKRRSERCRLRRQLLHQRLADDPTPRQRVGAAPAHVENRAVLIEPEQLIGERAHQQAQRRVGLQQFLRAQLERALEHGAVVVELPVGLVDRRKDIRHAGRDAVVGEVALDLTPQQAVKVVHRYRSVNVVTVIVWLCSSQRALAVNGEISPYE